MTKLSVGIGCKYFRISDHALNSLIRSVCSSLINVDALKLNIERAYVVCAEPDNVGSYFFHLYSLLFSFDLLVRNLHNSARV